jgi:mono/diheme cytochrome c family protein
VSRPGTAIAGSLVLLAGAAVVPACDDTGTSLPAVEADASALVDPAVLQRGEYLVRSVAGCGECHTPRDAQGNLEMSEWLSGVANRFDLVPDDPATGAPSSTASTPRAPRSFRLCRTTPFTT